MVKFGASMLSWIPAWTPEAGLFAIEQTANAGFDLLEMVLPASLDFDARTVRKQLKAQGIEGRLTLLLPKACHLAFYPEAGLKLLKAALDKVEALESDFLGGVLYGAIGTFTGQPATGAERKAILDVMLEIAGYAKERAITVALEPINRYETYLYTSAAEVLALIESSGADNLGLHLDTFHMNIEENSFYQPLIQARSTLKHVHMTESDRGMLGEGNVHWDDLFRGLTEIKYTGPLVLENFSSTIKELVGPTSLWRPSKYNAQELARGSLAFMQNKAAAWHLT